MLTAGVCQPFVVPGLTSSSPALITEAVARFDSQSANAMLDLADRYKGDST